MKKLFSVILSLMLVFTVFACANKSGEVKSINGEKIYKIGTLQLVQHAALDASYQGFIDYLNTNGIKFEKSLEIRIQSPNSASSSGQTQYYGAVYGTYILDEE